MNRVRTRGTRNKRANVRLEGRTKVTELDVRESNGSIGMLSLNVGWDTRCRGAVSTHDTRLRGVFIEGVAAVQPQHVGGVVVPNAHNQNHAVVEGPAHSLEAALGSEVVSITEGGFSIDAELVGDRIVGGD